MRKRNILEYFHEDADDTVRNEIEQSLSEDEVRELDLLKVIWEESEHLKDHFETSSAAAWTRIAGSLEDDVAVEEPKPRKSPARRVPLRRYVAAAAAVIVLVIASRWVLRPADLVIEPKTFASAEEAQEYAFEELYPIAEELLKRAEKDEFENKVYTSAGDRFDGETNVLVRDVLGEEALKRNWKQKFASFQNIEGNNYYPQVYIPDYEDYDEKEGDPVLVFYLNDQEGPNGYEYMGYTVDGGELKEYGPVNETNLESLKVWVMSINENVDNDGNVLQDLLLNSEGVEHAGRIREMAIYDPKESWAGGVSEVRMRAYIESVSGVDADGVAIQSETHRSTSSPLGITVRNFTRDEIIGKHTIELDYPIVGNWEINDFDKDAVQLSYVLFEADVWPNSINEASYQLPNGDSRLFKYSSAQEHYDIGGIFGAKPPEQWTSPAYPEGVQDSQMIWNFSRKDQDIFFTTHKKDKDQNQ